jgi:hypothetical protein
MHSPLNSQDFSKAIYALMLIFSSSGKPILSQYQHGKKTLSK